MKYKYCGETMTKLKEWFARDPQDFSEINYLCPNCKAECDVSEPYGEDWEEGCIHNGDGNDEL